MYSSSQFLIPTPVLWGWWPESCFCLLNIVVSLAWPAQTDDEDETQSYIFTHQGHHFQLKPSRVLSNFASFIYLFCGPAAFVLFKMPHSPQWMYLMENLYNCLSSCVVGESVLARTRLSMSNLPSRVSTIKPYYTLIAATQSSIATTTMTGSAYRSLIVVVDILFEMEFCFYPRHSMRFFVVYMAQPVAFRNARNVVQIDQSRAHHCVVFVGGQRAIDPTYCVCVFKWHLWLMNE